MLDQTAMQQVRNQLDAERVRRGPGLGDPDTNRGLMAARAFL
jgi:hypothetical protein